MKITTSQEKTVMSAGEFGKKVGSGLGRGLKSLVRGATTGAQSVAAFAVVGTASFVRELKK